MILFFIHISFYSFAIYFQFEWCLCNTWINCLYFSIKICFSKQEIIEKVSKVLQERLEAPFYYFVSIRNESFVYHLSILV